MKNKDLDPLTRWDKDVANFDADLKKVEKFFLDVIAGKLSEEETIRSGFRSLVNKDRGTRSGGRCRS